jgi:subtilisin family serine protease
MEKGAPREDCFAKQQGRSPPPRSFARTGFILAVCTPLAIAPVPAAAFGGFGIGGGWGALGLFHHGFGGGFGTGPGMRLPGAMRHGMAVYGGKGLRGGSPSGPRPAYGHNHYPVGSDGNERGFPGRSIGKPASGKSIQTNITKPAAKKSIQMGDGKPAKYPTSTNAGQTAKDPNGASDGNWTRTNGSDQPTSTPTGGCSESHRCPPPFPPTPGQPQPGSGVPPPQVPGGGGVYPPPIDQAGPASAPPRPPHKNGKVPPAPIEPAIAKASPPHPNSGVPAIDERRFVQREVLFELRKDVSPQTADAVADAIARRERLQRLASQSLDLIGTTLYRYKIKDKRSVPAVIASLERYPQVAAVQPNYVYTLQQAGQNGHFVEEQYAVPKMHLAEAHMISNGEKTLVAVIDSGIDWTHPEISGAVTRGFNAIGGDWEKAQHGTEIAGIIASHAALTGVAPQAHILAVRAFAIGGGRTAVAGTTYDILAGIEWAVKNKAQVVNMSFAGPPDPDLSRELSAGAGRRVTFIAAVGNEGKAAKPSYPAAYEYVIPVTATDQSDAIFKDASRCTTTCVAAPGVDIYAAAPAGAYKYDSGTSMAAAEISGVVALLLDAKPGLDPKAVRDLLVQTAKHLSPADAEKSSIAGVVDAYAMLEAAAAAGPTVENAPPIIERRSAGRSDPQALATPKDAEPPQNAPPVDNSPTGSIKPDTQSDSTSLTTATDAELDKKEDVLWQLKKDGLLSPDKFQREFQDLEAAKTEFVNKCPAAPHFPGVVKAEFQESDRARAAALIRDYGLEAKDSADVTKITVPVGQEWFWVDVLQASGLFTHVGREDYFCTKSVDTEFGIGHPDIGLSAPTANIPPAADFEDVVSILKKKYPRPSEVKVIERHQNFVKVEIDGLRGSVLSGHNYWERLEIHLILLKPGEGEAMVEGYYAPGIGASPPATSAYESMEKEYYADLTRYTKLTFANLQ